jgi:hypothetical protein
MDEHGNCGYKFHELREANLRLECWSARQVAISGPDRRHMRMKFLGGV